MDAFGRLGKNGVCGWMLFSWGWDWDFVRGMLGVGFGVCGEMVGDRGVKVFALFYWLLMVSLS